MKKSTNPLWGGRFENNPSDLLQKINNSIGFDHKLALQDIKLNLEYSKSLKKAKIITDQEYKKIKNAWNDHTIAIKKFGRYPHRNKSLNRISTKEEELFLKQPNSSW